ncbi:MAG: DUF262 domain-containing protein [Candidatus Marinimicrobia bacterium]|nr:DUF262 domain-containing protein [Candidatus Neomarinimicrobiota bacterium]
MNESTTNDYIPQELTADGREAGVESEEYNPFPFDAEKISISDKRVPLQTIIRRLKQGTITAPPIQRGAGIWDDEQQSRLIESLMLKIPVPLFYVAEEEDINWKVVDGIQRITAINRYVVRQEFKLSGLEFLCELEGCKFDNLPPKYQNRILETEFQFAIINPSTPQNVQRNVFKRLNTGGLPLTAQEIRHALYYGPSAELLAELARSKDFKEATAGSVNDSRMAGRELILRFFAFLIRGVDSYPKNEDMDDFLSGTMQIINLMPELPQRDLVKVFNADIDDIKIRYRTHDQLKIFFHLAMKRAKALFDDYAFRKAVPNQDRRRTPINKSLFETWSVLLSEMKDEEYQALLKKKKHLYSLLEAATYCYANDDLSKFISRDSHKYQGVIKRYKIFNDLTAISIRNDNLDDVVAIIKKDDNLENALHKILNSNNLQDTISNMENSHD